MSDITWQITAPPAGAVGIPYEAGLAHTGANSPVTAMTISSGALPPGLTISNLATISGTPTHAGTYVFKVTATNTAGAVQSPSLSILVDYTWNENSRNTMAVPVSAQYAKMWH